MSMIPSMASSNKTVREYDLIPDGLYPARVVRTVGLGVQDQPPYQGQAKDPAFKNAFTFELFEANAETGQITNLMSTGVEIKGQGTDDEVRTPLEPQPACQFSDMFLFPGAQRGKVFDLCAVLSPGIERVPGDLGWFKDQLNSVVQVQVGRYTVKNGPNAGRQRNTIRAISPFPTFMHRNVPAAATDVLAFDPYEDSEANTAAYAKLYKFQRDILADAKDSKHIPYAGKEPIDGSASNASAPKTADSATSQTIAADDKPF